MNISKDEFKARATAKMALVQFDSKELGGTVTLRPLTVGQKAEWQHSLRDEQGLPDAVKYQTCFVRMLSLCLIDDEGKQLFSFDDLTEMDPAVIEPLVLEVKRINGSGDNPETTNSEELKKN